MGGGHHVPVTLPPRDPVPIAQGSGWVLQPVWKAQKILLSLWFNPWMVQPIASHYTYHAKPATMSRVTLWSNVYTNIIMFFVRYKHHITKQCDLYYCPKVMKYFIEQLTVESWQQIFLRLGLYITPKWLLGGRGSSQGHYNIEKHKHISMA